MPEEQDKISTLIIKQVNKLLQNNWVNGQRDALSAVRPSFNKVQEAPCHLFINILLECLAKALDEEKLTHQSAIMAHDGFPQRVVNQDLLVLNVYELTDTTVERALGIGLADLALTWDAQYR